MSDAREAVMSAVRAALGSARGAPAPLPDGPVPAPLPTPGTRAERFARRLEALGAPVFRAADETAAAEVLARLVRELGARDVALSDAPLVARLAADLADVTTFDGSTDRARLLACDLGVSCAQLGVAETGTLVLESDRERHRLVSLVPPEHVAVLRAADLVEGLGDALAAIAARGPAPAVTFVTGPSRTADIEITLVVGVHGPRRLQVILIGDERA